MDIEMMEIAGHRAPCVGSTTQLCLVVKKPGQASLGLFYDSIEGLAPRWGREYTVEMDVVPVPNPPADGSSLRYVLRTIVRDEAVPPGRSFNFRVFDAGSGVAAFVTVLGAADGRLMDGTTFICPTASTCSDIQVRLSRSGAFDILFEHRADSLAAIGVADVATNGPAAQ
jgi:hypothetical protein